MPESHILFCAFALERSFYLSWMKILYLVHNVLLSFLMVSLGAGLPALNPNFRFRFSESNWFPFENLLRSYEAQTCFGICISDKLLEVLLQVKLSRSTISRQCHFKIVGGKC